jgi:hypothetical protein
MVGQTASGPECFRHAATQSLTIDHGSQRGTSPDDPGEQTGEGRPSEQRRFDAGVPSSRLVHRPDSDRFLPAVGPVSDPGGNPGHPEFTVDGWPPNPTPPRSGSSPPPEPAASPTPSPRFAADDRTSTTSSRPSEAATTSCSSPSSDGPQHGDPDAAVVVVWALLPRLCGYFRSCLPVEQWRQAVDECLALNYLTVCDVSMAEKPEFLLHKLITRTRQRYERAVNARRPVPIDNEQLNAITPSIHDVEQQAIARVELDQLRHAVADGIVSQRCWQALVATRLDPTDRITSGADRMAAMRAHRALTAWRDAAA